MEQVSIRILNLPKEIQDYIYMFNPEHREMMKQVCEELTYTECYNACGWIIPKHDAMRGSCFEGYYCSLHCLYDDEDYRRKASRKKN